MDLVTPLNTKEPLSNSQFSDILIVGAGLSGLTTALKIQQKERSLQIKILEASNTVGGKMVDSRLGEIGAKWITKNQYHMHNLLEMLKVPTRHRLVLAPRLKRCWDIDRGWFSSLAKYELNRYLRELELRVQFFKPGRFNFKMRSKSMHKHICNRLFFNKSRNFMANLVLMTCGEDALEVTYSQFMSICYTCGGLQMLLDIYLEFPTSLLEVPSEKLLQAFTEKLKHTDIHYWRKVYEVHQHRDYVEVRDSEHDIHKASVVVFAIPWNNLQDIYISPALPLELHKAHTPMQQKRKMVTSFIAEYTEGYWRIAGFSGNFFSNYPLLVGNEYRPTSFAGMMFHEEGSEQLVRSLALQKLAFFFGESMLSPTAYTQRTFELSSSANFPFTTPWRRIVWSSSAAAATCYRGCLSGAVQSGLRAAMNALLVVRPQTVSWEDIAEIQRSDRLRQDVTWLRLYMSTWNLYNVTYYGIFTYGLVYLLRMLYRRK